MLAHDTKIRLTKWIHAEDCVARVEVDGIIPDFDDSEPYLEPAVVRFLDHLQELANAGQTDELARHGRVYVSRTV